MSHRPAVLAVALALTSALTAAPAHAGNVALESYTGERPADASRLLSPILDELATRGFAAGDTLARSYETQVSRPAQTQAGLPADFSAQIDRGFKAWVAGKFEDAIKLLGPLVENAHANTGAFAKDQALRDPLLKAMIALALSQQRTGDPGAARATFLEMLRSFPGTQLSRATYGPEAYELFEQVRREALAAGKGHLSVKTLDEGAVVFVDETYQAMGATAADVVPGDYRVCAMINRQPSRSHRVVVRPGAETGIFIDAGLDQTIRTSGFTGFSFATEAARDAHEAAYAAQFANAINASAVAVIGIDQVRGHAAIVGSLVSLQTGREIRRASVALEPDPSTDRLRALAKFLAGDEPAPGLEVQLGAGAKAAPMSHTAESPHRDEGARAGGRWGGWKWLTGGLAVAALGTGGALVYLDGRCSMTPIPGRQCNDLYSTATPGFITLGGGAVLAGVSIYLFATGHAAPSRTAYLVPTANGAVAGFATSW